MQPKEITPNYLVGGQIEPRDIATLAAQGVSTVICNRPDEEIGAGGPTVSAEIEKAAQEAGLAFHYNPLSNGGLSMDHINTQGEILANAEGKIFAYCFSGMRSTILWAFTQAGQLPASTIVKTAADQGYDISRVADQLATLNKA